MRTLVETREAVDKSFARGKLELVLARATDWSDATALGLVLLRAGLAGGVVGILCGCPPSNPGQCLEWVDVGETYDVELVRRLDGNLWPLPHPEFRASAGPCLEGLGLAAGDVLSFEAIDTYYDEQYSCFDVRAGVDIPGVTPVGGASTAARPLDFSMNVSAVVNETCGAQYHVGLVPVSEGYLSRPGRIPSDHMLIRTVITAGRCELDGETIGSTECQDYWAVRIRDADGRLVSRDIEVEGGLPAEPSESTGDDAGVGGGDGGQS